MISRTLFGALTLSILLGTSGFGMAEDRELKHPIDSWYDQCQDKDPSTAGIVQCAAEAGERWDAELNLVYKKLLANLSPEQKSQIKESQRQWISFRDRESEFMGGLYGSFQGTMWRPVAADAVMRLTRDRTLELQKYLEEVVGEQ